MKVYLPNWKSIYWNRKHPEFSLGVKKPPPDHKNYIQNAHACTFWHACTCPVPLLTGGEAEAATLSLSTAKQLVFSNSS